MGQTNRLGVLINNYNIYFSGLIGAETLLAGLKKLDPEMILRVDFETQSPQGLTKDGRLMPVVINRLVKDRIKEVEQEILLLKTRVEAIQEAIETEKTKING